MVDSWKNHLNITEKTFDCVLVQLNYNNIHHPFEIQSILKIKWACNIRELLLK